MTPGVAIFSFQLLRFSGFEVERLGVDKEGNFVARGLELDLPLRWENN